ncbi:MAG: hypothetical protein M0Z91_10470 [Actinomycetota bacterium]|nr:hypothetical protein [Actinomycetota bacterium]
MNPETRNPAKKCGYLLAGADGRALSVSAHDGAVAGDTRVEPGARLCVDYAHGKWLFAAIDPPTAGSLASLRVSRSEDWPPRLFKVELPAAHRRLAHPPDRGSAGRQRVDGSRIDRGRAVRRDPRAVCPGDGGGLVHLAVPSTAAALAPWPRS